jgi:hypothetical protein
MGLIYQSNKGLVTSFKEETTKWSKALIEPGKGEAEVKLAPLTSEEVNAILLKLDILASEKANPAIAAMIAEEMESILIAIRMVKSETKASFAGILGAGSNLDIKWLRPKDVGGSLLNSAGTSSKGLYSGTSGGVYTWLNSFTANTSDDLIPSQTMAEEAAVIHMGAIDPVEVPKIESIKFTLAGIASPAQSTPFNIRKTLGTEDLPVVRFEKPVIVGPEKTQAIDVMPNITGDSKFQLLSFLIARAQDLTL